jgi:hypothetical protein
MELWAYDDNALRRPLVYGDTEYIEDFKDRFLRIDGNHAVYKRTLTPFDVQPGDPPYDMILSGFRVMIEVPQGSGLHILFQGYEWDLNVKDGVGIRSVRHDRSENLGIGPEQALPELTGGHSGYQILYTIRCLEIGTGPRPEPFFHPDTRFTFLDATFTDNTAQSHVAAAHIALNINGRILHIPSSTPADLGTVPMTSGVPLTFIEDPAVEFQRGDRAQISITFRDDSIRRSPAGFIGDCPGADDIDPGSGGRVPLACIPRLLSITLSNSHGSTDSNFEGVHSISTSTPIRVTDVSGTTHEISLTIRYRLDVL